MNISANVDDGGSMIAKALTYYHEKLIIWLPYIQTISLFSFLRTHSIDYFYFAEQARIDFPLS
jgi:hypothetical protein